MKRISVLMLLMIYTVSTVQASTFIKFDGLDGESYDKDHKSWSDMLDFTQSIQRQAIAAGEARRGGSTVFEDIIITKEIDKISPKIAEAIATGKVFPKVQIHVTEAFTDGWNNNILFL